jgi:GT2 family glycosyltransferase
MISLVAPVGSVKSKYAINLRKNIGELYPNKDKVEVIIYENDNVTLGTKYNMAVDMAKGEKIILLHDDMVLRPGFVEEMNKYIEKNKIVTYTRIEPPIYNDLYPGKIIENCGFDLEDFNQEKFYNIKVEDKVVSGGSQIFFGCLKEDYIGFDGNTFEIFCEDDDIHLRYKLGGFESIVCPAALYHFVSKTSRTKEGHQQRELNSNRNFIRKWGFRQSKHFKKYNIAFVVKNCNLEMMAMLEPWCDRLYTDDEMGVLFAYYYDAEQKNTSYDLEKRILTTKYNHPLTENDIVIEFNGRDLNQESFNIIQNLSDIITESGEIGKFELDIFTITINDIKSYEESLIKVGK